MAAHPATPAVAVSSGWRATVAAYLALTKPRIIELLLITTVPSMVLAARGWPGTWLVAATLVGGTFSAAGANALNSYLDRDIDRVMKRTSGRPLPRNLIRPEGAAWFGVVLGGLGFAWLAAFTTTAAAITSTSALLFYVVIYTRWLKRTTTENIVIGGAAGAAPALVGWAAVHDSIGLPAWALFAVVFYWTPPHFWALSLRYRDEYAAAGVPMLPAVRGVEVTTRRIVAYTGVLALVSLLLVPIAGLGWIYLVAATVLGGWLLMESFRLAARPERAMRMFGHSNLYLALLFAAVMVDVLL
jgi:protoheme IX farnesyltransferase